MGGVLPVHCVPSRALRLITEYSSDLWVGTFGSEMVALRESSRHLSPALCVVWWKVVRDGNGDRLIISEMRDACRRAVMKPLKLRDGARQTTAWCADTGVCVAVVSNNWILKTRDMDGVAAWDTNEAMGRLCIVPHGEACARAFGVPLFRSLLAASESHLLVTKVCAREVKEIRQQPSVYPALELMSVPIAHPEWTETNIGCVDVREIMAASFLDSSPERVFCVLRDLSVSVNDGTGEFVSVGHLFDRTLIPYSASSFWNCTLVKESPNQFVFVMLFDVGSSTKGGSLLIRFSLSHAHRRLVLLRTTHHMPGTTGAGQWMMNPYTRLPASPGPHLDPSSSFLVINASSQRDITKHTICFFDRRTLTNFSRGILYRRDNLQPYDHSFLRFASRLVPDPAVVVVIKGIEHAKEKRMAREHKP